jgi:hypothetical protein
MKLYIPQIPKRIESADTDKLSTSALVKQKASRVAQAVIPRRLSEIDLRGLKEKLTPRATQSLPTALTQGLNAPEQKLRVDPEMKANLNKLVGRVHAQIAKLAIEDPSMAPGLAVVGKLSRSDEMTKFRQMFISNPGAAVSKIMSNVAGVELAATVEKMISRRLMTPDERTMLFDALMADPLTANMATFLVTQPALLRLGLKLQRAMLFKVTAIGRWPQRPSTMSATDKLQALTLLFKKEKLTPVQVTIDTILLAVGHDALGLAGTLINELFVDEKHRVHGFAGTLATQLATQVHGLVQKKIPGGSLDKKTYKREQTRLLQEFADRVWNAEAVEEMLGKYVGTQKAKSFIAELQGEGERISLLAAELRAEQG